MLRAFLIAFLWMGLVFAACTMEEEEGAKPRAEAPGGTPTVAEAGKERPARIVQAAPGAVAEAEGIRVTLNEIRDPFEPAEIFAQPYEGNRFVVFDVTIERTGSGGRFVWCGDFKLIDADGFVYEESFDAVFALGTENLPTLDGTNIGKGEKVRGWCGFEVRADAKLSVLKYDPNPFTTNDIEFRFQE